MYNFNFFEQTTYDQREQFEGKLEQGLVTVTGYNVVLNSCLFEDEDFNEFQIEINDIFDSNPPSEFAFDPDEMNLKANWKLDEPINLCSEKELLEAYCKWFTTTTTRLSRFIDPCINYLEVEFYTEDGKPCHFNLHKTLPATKLGELKQVRFQGKITEIEGIKIDSVEGEQRKRLLQKIVNIIKYTNSEIGNLRYRVEHDGVIVEWSDPNRPVSSPFSDTIIDFYTDEYMGEHQ